MMIQASAQGEVKILKLLQATDSKFSCMLITVPGKL